jgi:chromosomal replication initiation ATPase DnaA
MESKKYAMMRHALQIVCLETMTEEHEVRGPNRARPLADARKVFWHVLFNQNEITVTYVELGTFLNRDHATVMAGVRAATTLLEYDKRFHTIYLRVRKKMTDLGVFTPKSVYDFVPQF